MKNRLTQLLARYIGLALATVAAWLGAEAEAASIAEMAGTIASGLVAFVLLLFDQLVHRAETGGVLKPAGTRKLGLLLAPLLMLGTVGCTHGQIETPLVRGWVNPVEADHKLYYQNDPNRSPEEVAAFDALYANMHRALDAAEGGTGDE